MDPSGWYVFSFSPVRIMKIYIGTMIMRKVKALRPWLKSKYCGPYSYEGVGEHYIPAQIEVDRFRKDWPAIQKKTTDQRTWNVYMEGQCEEMLERAPDALDCTKNTG